MIVDAQAFRPTPQPVRGEPDWFRINWWDVWEHCALAPHQVPGVRDLGAASLLEPFPYWVHRTHLPPFGFASPPAALPSLDEPPLRPHQREGKAFILDRRGTLLADEQRVGKTPQIMWSIEPDYGPAIISAPLKARQVWHEWSARRFGACYSYITTGDCVICKRVGAVVSDRASFLAVTGRTPDFELVKRARPHVVFMHFQIVYAWSMLFSQFPSLSLLAVDEAHLAGLLGRRNQSVEGMRRLNTRAHRCIMSTGTPLFSRFSGLWPMLDMAAPGAFGKYWAYATRYCAARPGPYGWTAEGETNADELRARLGEIMLRRTWPEIRGAVPPITRTIEIVPFSERDKDRVMSLAAEIRRDVGGISTVAGEMARLRRLYAKVKVEAAVEKITEALSIGQSVVAWTWHNDVANDLFQRLCKENVNCYGPVCGQTGADDAEAIQEAARSDTKPRVIIATMASLSTAVNLSWASGNVFVELDFTPLYIAQAEMRPFDGTKPIWSLFLAGDIEPDERLAESLISKLEAQERLGLKAGVGDVADVLATTFKIEQANSGDLNALARQLVAAAEAEI